MQSEYMTSEAGSSAQSAKAECRGVIALMMVSTVVDATVTDWDSTRQSSGRE